MRLFYIPFFLSLFFYHSCFSQQSPEDDYEYLISSKLEIADYQGAVELAKAWAEEEKENRRAQYVYAKTLLRSGKSDDSQKILTEILEADSQFIPALYLLAQASRSNSLDYWEKLMELDTINIHYRKKAAEVAMETGDFQRAITLYNQILEIAPQDVVSNAGLGGILLDLRQYQQADSLLSIALDAEPGNYAVRLLAAKSVFLQEKWEETIALLDTLMKNEGIYHPTAAKFYGISLHHTGNYQESNKFLLFLTNQFRDLDYPHYYMGLNLLKLNQPERAEVQFRQALNKALSPNLSLYYENLGHLAFNAEEMPKAIGYFEMAKYFDGGPEVLYHLARAYDAYYADRSTALRTYQKYVELRDSIPSPEVDFALSRINEIKKEMHFDTETK